MGDDYQTPGKTQAVTGTRNGPLVGEVLGDFFQAAPDEPVERLQKKKGFSEAVEQLPRRVTARQVGQLMGEEALFVLDGEIVDPFRATHLWPLDTGGEGYRDRGRGAQADLAAHAHSDGQSVEKLIPGAESPRLQQASEIERRPAESQHRQKRANGPE